MRFLRLSFVGLVMVVLVLGGCVRPAPDGSANNPAGISFTLVPLEVRLGDPEGAPLEDHVRATDRQGAPVTNLGFSMGAGVILKSFPTSGLVGSGSLRAFAPLESCSHLQSDVIHVTATGAGGETADADLPVVILGATDATVSAPADTSPGAAADDSSDDSSGESDNAAPALSVEPVAAASSAPSLALTAPAPGETMDGVTHVAAGRATGLSQVTLWVRSRTGDYDQGACPVDPSGHFQAPFYLGEAGPHTGQGEEFTVWATSVDGKVKSAPVRVTRGR